MYLLFGRSIELLCIDLDDTLIDTEAVAPVRFATAVNAIRSIRPELATAAIEAAVDRALRTHPTEGRVANFLSDLAILDADEVIAVRAAYFERMMDGLRIVEGGAETLAALRRHVQIAIVTNGPSELQREKLALLDLERQVDWIVISGEVGYEKPDTAIFQHTLDLTGIDASRAAHVGDSLLTDVAGANDAGLHSIWLRSPLVAARPDDARLRPAATIAHVSELLGGGGPPQ